MEKESASTSKNDDERARRKQQNVKRLSKYVKCTKQDEKKSYISTNNRCVCARRKNVCNI